MKKITVAEVESGMVLAKEVVSSQGMILLDKGVCLSGSQITTLRKWGISHLYVQAVAT
nr:hypothetical protein [uncultured Anaeromusa sp.]